MNRSRAGRKSPQVVIDGTHCNEFMVCPDAFSAQNAFAQIPDNKRVGLLQGFVIGHRIKIRFANSHLSGDPAKLAAITFAADDTGFRMLGNHQSRDIAAMPEDTRGVGSDGHIRGYRRHTRCHQPSGFFIFDQAQPAGTKGFQIGMIAQVRDSNFILRGRFQYRSPGWTADRFVIDG
jgi:hypothetical protein